MPIVAVVADANVLLSAAVGKAARRVFDEFAVTAHAAEFTCREVAEYLPFMAEKYRLETELVLLSWKMLPIVIHSFSRYERNFPKAFNAMKGRDPEDAHALALAGALRLPLWTNDRDFTIRGLNRYTTAVLLNDLKPRLHKKSRGGGSPGR